MAYQLDRFRRQLRRQTNLAITKHRVPLKGLSVLGIGRTLNQFLVIQSNPSSNGVIIIVCCAVRGLLV